MKQAETVETGDLAARAYSQLEEAILSVSDQQVHALAERISEAGKVVLYGGGREGLSLRGWTMRLHHAGVDANYVGDVTCPPVGKGDVVVLSSGPGLGDITWALARLAKREGAHVVLTTAQPDSPLAKYCDSIFVIDAQTMADDQGSDTILPMGSAFEVALMISGDLVARQVRDLRQEDAESMRLRHANLE